MPSKNHNGDDEKETSVARPKENPLADRHWRDIVNVIHDPIMIHDKEFRVIGANDAYLSIADTSMDVLWGQPYWRFFPRRDGPLPSCGKVMGDKYDRSDDEFIHDNGRVYRSRGFAVYAPEQGEHDISVHLFQDITEETRIALSLRHSEEQFRLMASAIDDVFWLSTPDLSRFDYVSPAFANMWNIAPSLLLESPSVFIQTIHPDDRERVVEQFLTYREQMHEEEYRLKYADGGEILVHDRRYPIRDPSGEVRLIAGVAGDITLRKKQELELRHQGTHDQLSGLPNRTLIRDRLEQMIAHAHRHQGLVAVCFLDLDRFKMINDSLGHRAGDRVLQEVAERLRNHAREGDTVGRFGGDEFVVLLSDLADQDDAIDVARRLVSELARPVFEENQELHITGSLGISIYPRDGEDVDTLLRNADTAMYRAKELGRNSFQFFTSEMNTRVLNRLTLEGALRRALERQEFELYYQPQVALNTGYITGVEALVRWHHPELGFVGPDEFIGISEDTGLIVPLGDWVLATACAQIKSWQQEDLPPISVSLNASPRQFGLGTFVASVRKCIEQGGFEPKLLELELTESILVASSEELLDELQQLKEIGVQIALDDFGTGYSSLNYLHRYPFDTLKIDQSFVRDVITNPDNATITRTIIAMAHGLKMRVVAEGVETAEQASYLRRGYCDEMQGYYVSRPMPAAQFTELLRQRKTWPPANNTDGTERHTLLIVDDDQNVVHALGRVLRHDGYRVIVADNAKEGLTQLALHGAAVVISDQRMPGMNGTEFLARVKEIHPNTVRVLLTGFPDLATATEAVNTGAVFKFIAKPWDNGEITTLLREAFRRYEMNVAPPSFG